MIVRVFQVAVHDGKQDEFAEFFHGTALPLVNRVGSAPSRSIRHRSRVPARSEEKSWSGAIWTR